MSARASTAELYKELEKLPEHVVGEIVGGELYVSPRPASPHARAASVLGGELFGPFDRGRNGPGGWILLDEPELHLGDDVMVPDMAGWRRERMPRLLNVPYFTLAPDWICEVLSKSTARLDIRGKLPRYAQAGINHAWIIDPIYRTLQVFRRRESEWTLVGGHGGEDKVRAEPFDALELELGTLWLPDEDPPPER